MEYRLHLLLLLLHCLYFLSIKRNRLTSLWIKIAVIYGGEYMDGLLRGFFSIDAVLLLHLCGWAGLFPSSLHLLCVFS